MTSIHFLNVGHGDCTIIEHASGRITMVDINNSDSLDGDTRREIAEEYGITGIDYATKTYLADLLGESFRRKYLAEFGYNIPLTDPVDYLRFHWPGRPIFRYIQTHPDCDHLRGLERLRQEGIPILNFWDTSHSRTITDLKGSDEAEWKEYQRLRFSTENPKVLRLNRDTAHNKYWNQDDEGGSGDGIYVLAPTPELTNAANKSDDPNAHSYALWLQYGNYKVVLGGDCDESAWQSIWHKYGSNLGCNVLKASHHGRLSGFHLESVKAMNPEFTIVSVGKRPSTDASNRYRIYTSKKVWSTRWRGNMVLTINDSGAATISSQFNTPSPAASQHFDLEAFLRRQ
jgi:beta-lactamase superfamily II metal-dependent hydrolase